MSRVLEDEPVPLEVRTVGLAGEEHGGPHLAELPDLSNGIAFGWTRQPIDFYGGVQPSNQTNQIRGNCGYVGERRAGAAEDPKGAAISLPP